MPTRPDPTVSHFAASALHKLIQVNNALYNMEILSLERRVRTLFITTFFQWGILIALILRPYFS